MFLPPSLQPQSSQPQPRKQLRRSRDSSGGGSNSNNSNNSSSSNNNNNPQQQQQQVSPSSYSGHEWYDYQGNASIAYQVLYPEYDKGNHSSSPSAASAAASSKPTPTQTNDSTSKRPSNSKTPTMAHRYNQVLLQRLVRNPSAKSATSPSHESPSSYKDWLVELDAVTTAETATPTTTNQSPAVLLSPRKRQRNEWILLYNRALILWAHGQWESSATVCGTVLHPLLLSVAQKSNDSSSSSTRRAAVPSTATTTTTSPSLPLDLAKVAARLAFVWLETMLATHCMTSTITINNVTRTTAAHDLLQWLEGLALWKQDDEFKFLVSLYKGRVDLAAAAQTSMGDANGPRTASTTTTAGHDEEVRLRSARKELKTAMEIFQHKLRVMGSHPPMSSHTTNSTTATETTTTMAASQQHDNVSVNSSVDGSSKDNNNHKSNSSLDVVDNNTASTGDSSSHLTQESTNNRGTMNSGSKHTNGPLLSWPLLQKLHQSALNLKANLEQLKGNVKKSLILCHEAHLDTTTTTSVVATGKTSNNNNNNGKDDYYQDIHANNLALIYQTHHKQYLAWHVLAKTIFVRPKLQQQQTPSHVLFGSDGTAAPVQTLSTIWNAALCAMQARKFEASYQCFAICLRQEQKQQTQGDNNNTMSTLGHGRTLLLWLRLAEACLGIYHQQQQQQQTSMGDATDPYNARAIRVEGEPRGLVIGPSLDGEISIDVPAEDKALPELASAQDLEWFSRHPLKRARWALEHLVDGSLFPEKKDVDAAMSENVQEAARLSLAYLCLLNREYDRALDLAQSILPNGESPPRSDSQTLSSSPSTSSTTNNLGESLRSRRYATARMYAAEAACCLGDAPQAMKYLVHNNNNNNVQSQVMPSENNGNNNAWLDRLASDLAGVTIETAAVSRLGKRRLARAQTLVRATTSVVTATLGGPQNMTVAKQLAMSAQAMEDALTVSGAVAATPTTTGIGNSSGGGGVFPSQNTTAATTTVGNHFSVVAEDPWANRSVSRRALLYCNLRAGNSSAALSLLQSLRR